MGKVFFCGHVGRNLLRVSDTTIFVGQVTAILEDGRRFEGDLLVGADGIWSKVMRLLLPLVRNKHMKA